MKTALIPGVIALLAVGAPTARAADLAAKPIAPTPAPAPFDFFKGIEFHVQGEAGIIGNPAVGDQVGPYGSQNVGSLYEDRANEPTLNQVLFTITKPIDPKETGFALGFTGQGLYGGDERYNHYLGIADSTISSRDQLGVFQAFVAAHLPIFTTGGVDVKVGLFSSPQGFETTDPSTNPFYSHSYIYNYAVTFNHTGVLTTTHINSTVDFYLGVDTGNQTTFGSSGSNAGDPNGTIAGFVGFGLNNLLDNKLTVLALSHIGPEQNFFNDPNANKDLRYYNDVVFTYKVNDDLTSVTELNYSRDEFGNLPGSTAANGVPLPTGTANFYGIAQYFAYTLNKEFTLNVRGEVDRDDQGFFVANFPDNLGLVKTERGNLPTNPANYSPGPTTYGAITLGVTYKPDVPKPLALVLIRPEVRYDRALSGNNPYNLSSGGVGRSKDQFTFGADLVVGF